MENELNVQNSNNIGTPIGMNKMRTLYLLVAVLLVVGGIYLIQKKSPQISDEELANFEKAYNTIACNEETTFSDCPASD
jgi:hypothetical protein